MIKVNITIILILLSGLLINSCNLPKKNSTTSNTVNYSGPLAIVYKTRKDYFKNVPVSLSDDKSKIISYPGISDVYYKGEIAYPSKLEKGYLLDNRGININTAFLSLSYEEYIKLKEVPSLTELYYLIIDKDPLKELYNCGNRNKFKEEINELNQIIKNKKLKDYKRLK